MTEQDEEDDEDMDEDDEKEMSRHNRKAYTGLNLPEIRMYNTGKGHITELPE